MNGILVVDKPEGFTSFDVVAKLRGICKTKKIGHGGTLDPMATGVLPVYVGPAVKAVDLAPNQDKTYEARVLFGVATDTGDITGRETRRADIEVTGEMLQAALPGFVGPQQQLPPMYSAVKVDGKPLYHYAREGKEVRRKTRAITVYALDMLGEAGGNQFDIRVHCSKGTYVRTLVEDIGAALNAPATLAALRRTAAGVFDIAAAHTLAQIQQAKDAGRLEALFLPAVAVFPGLPRCSVDGAAAARLLNGAPVYGLPLAPGRYGLLGPGGDFLGLGNVDADGVLRGEKLFVERA